MLTLLALAAPRPLSVDSIARSLWDEPPPAAVKTVQAHLSRIRTALAVTHPTVGAVEGSSAGYRLVAGPGALDVLVVEDLRRRARLCALAGDDAAAEALLREASAAWRGDPELPTTAAGDAEADRLAEERLLLVEDHLDALLAAGRSAETVGTLAALTANTRCGNGPGSCGSARSTWPAARPTRSTPTERCTGTCTTRWVSSRVPRCTRCIVRSSRRPCPAREMCALDPNRSWPPWPPTSRTMPGPAASTWHTGGSGRGLHRCCS